MNSQPSSLRRRHRIMIVDDHPIVRRGLMQVISEEGDMEVCAEAASVCEALRTVEETRPDAVVIDLALGGEDGFELIDGIKSRWPSMKMLVASAFDERFFAGRVLRAGALGYVSKHEALPQIVAALRHVLRGEVYLRSQTATCLLQRAVIGKALDADPIVTLSDREFQVFELLGQGLTVGQIAQQLQLSRKTVESHRQQIKLKLHLESSAQLSRRAFQWSQERHGGARC